MRTAVNFLTILILGFLFVVALYPAMNPNWLMSTSRTMDGESICSGPGDKELGPSFVLDKNTRPLFEPCVKPYKDVFITIDQITENDYYVFKTKSSNTDRNDNNYIKTTKEQALNICATAGNISLIDKFENCRLPTKQELNSIKEKILYRPYQKNKECKNWQKNGFCNVNLNELTMESASDDKGFFRCVCEKGKYF
jgi:hypothetical protein